MAIFEVADGKVHGLAQKTMKQHHGELAKAGVSLEVLFAKPNENEQGEQIGTPLKAGGLEVPFTTTITSLKHRTKGQKDLEIVLNYPRWEEMDDGQKVALLDHALCTIALVKNKEGTHLVDKLDRPRLRRRPPSHALGWYAAVAARHGEDAPAVRILRSIEKETKQLQFKFTMPEQEKQARRAERVAASEDAPSAHA